VNRAVRLVRNGVAAVVPGRKERVIEAIYNLTENIDIETVAYLVRRNLSLWSLLPGGIVEMMKPWLFLYAWMGALSTDELLEAAMDARPDCAIILNSAEGRRWLESMLTIF